MIARVSIDGTDVDLLDVFASVTIRHGREGVDDGPLASTSTLRLVNVDGDYAAAFETETELAIYLADDVPRFVGRITDAKLNEDGLSIIATSSLGWVSEQTVGAEDWPEEAWSARVRRAFAEAGAANTWGNMIGTWDDQPAGETWAAPFAMPLLTIEVGDDDPTVIARAAAPAALSAILGVLLADVPAAIANLPNGSVLVQALSARKSLAVLDLDPNLVSFAPEWTKVSDVVNIATVTYGEDLEVTATDEISRERYRDQPVEISTDLRDEADADLLARTTVYRGGVSDWLVGSVELLALDTDVTIGTPAGLSSLPSWAPSSSHVGMVEGWQDYVISDEDGELEWTQTVALSSPRLSGYAQDWASVPAGESWDDVAAGVTWARPDSIFN